MNQVRYMRIVGHEPDGWRVQYGFDRQRGATRRFAAIYEWPAADLKQAHMIAARENLNVVLQPAPVEARPLEEPWAVKRCISEAPKDTAGLLELAVAALEEDPLPTVEKLHARLGIPAPEEKKAGRAFYLYLPESVYARLVAMAAHAGTTRNRIIEALLLEV